MREILFAFLMLTPIYFFRKNFEPDFKWKFKALKPDISLLLILITVMHYFGISSYLTDVMPNVNFDGSVQFFYPHEISDIDYIFMILVVAPILEELLFTGIILDGFLKKYNPTFAILVYALFFGASHLNVAQSSQAFIGGLVSGFVYYKTKNLSYTILIHFVNNLMIFPGIYFKIFHAINANEYLIYLIIICSLPIYTIIYLTLRRRYSTENLKWKTG